MPIKKLPEPKVMFSKDLFLSEQQPKKIFQHKNQIKAANPQHLRKRSLSLMSFEKLIGHQSVNKLIVSALVYWMEAL